MKAKKNSVRRISWVIILLLPLVLAYHLIPQIYLKIHPVANTQALRNYAHETYESPEKIDMQNLWRMRNTLDDGFYAKNLDGIAFNTTKYSPDLLPIVSCLVQYPDDVRLVAYYHGTYWTSFEMLMRQSASETILKDCMQSETIEDSMDYRISARHGAIFMTVRPLETMRRTIGFIDYEGEHKEIVHDMKWLSLSHITLE